MKDKILIMVLILTGFGFIFQGEVFAQNCSDACDAGYMSSLKECRQLKAINQDAYHQCMMSARKGREACQDVC